MRRTVVGTLASAQRIRHVVEVVKEAVGQFMFSEGAKVALDVGGITPDVALARHLFEEVFSQRLRYRSPHRIADPLGPGAHCFSLRALYLTPTIIGARYALVKYFWCAFGKVSKRNIAAKRLSESPLTLEVS